MAQYGDQQYRREVTHGNPVRKEYENLVHSDTGLLYEREVRHTCGTMDDYGSTGYNQGLGQANIGTRTGTYGLTTAQTGYQGPGTEIGSTTGHNQGLGTNTGHATGVTRTDYDSRGRFTGQVGYLGLGTERGHQGLGTGIGHATGVTGTGYDSGGRSTGQTGYQSLGTERGFVETTVQPSATPMGSAGIGTGTRDVYGGTGIGTGILHRSGSGSSSSGSMGTKVKRKVRLFDVVGLGAGEDVDTKGTN
ncbi:hypothetical protein L1987_05757 [Smallanthus sonchifolius]|uniref:Uncharacterized protein n=1 Tax=Smallanthus sonchifolius TaxID=185202 RepID=A0ACB9JWC9_9ASTR|nr:hypothetical protein L1987_05757 [Smallanthus sonchifolius]